MTKFKDETVDGRKVEVYLTEAGTFQTEFGGETFDSVSLKGLLDAIRKRLRLERVKVEVTLEEWGWQEDPAKLVDGFLTGVHAAHGALLFRSVTGEASRVSRYGSNGLYRRLTHDEKAEFRRLGAAVKDAGKAFEKYKESLKVDGFKLLAEAQEAPPEVAVAAPARKGKGKR